MFVVLTWSHNAKLILTTEWLPSLQAAREMVVMRGPLTLIADYERLIA